MSHKILNPLSIEERANFIVEYNHNQGLLIEETETAMYALEPWEKLEGDEVIDNIEAWKEKQAQKERERLNELSMTRSDFFDGMILAFGLDSKELRAVIENILNSLNITDIEVKVALNNYDNALNFYRKHTLFTLLSGIEIPISEEVKIVITSEQWDKFFETKDYTYLLPSEQVEDESEQVSE